MINWANFALHCIAAEGSAAMITVVAVEGSAPREAGARMIVGATQIHGTVGGGNLEFLLIDQARRLLASNLNLLQQDYPLGPLLAQCCGGHVRLLIERLDAASRGWLTSAAEAETVGERYVLTANTADAGISRTFTYGWPSGATEGAQLFDASTPATRRTPWNRLVQHIQPEATHLLIFGAGHVGRALVHIAETLPFRLSWFDTRVELAGIDQRLTINVHPAAAAQAAPSGAFFVILTHAHELDYQLVRAILRRNDVGYCGLIGSATKRARFLSRLAKDGVDPSGLTCPIGGGMIRSKLPAAIALAAAMELLAHLEAIPATATTRTDAVNIPRSA
jgi:xanthine dehydrogenase accessory factor